MSADRRHLLECVRLQAGACAALGSPFYGALVPRLAADVERGGPSWRLLEPYAAEPLEAAVTLRLLGGVHRLVLDGRAPVLARHYPSVGGDGDVAAAWDAFVRLLDDAHDEVASWLARPPQTNEVGRAAALVCGLLTVARETRLPLRLLEVGASAGLNLRFDRYRYEDGRRAFGDPGSPVRFVDVWEGGAPFDASCTVATREGCDLHPVDPTTDAGRRTLVSYVWPDQAERLALLRGALEVAARVPARVDAAGAPDWLARKLAEPVPGTATVVFHSIVWGYLPAADQGRARDAIERAGARATPEAPLAWLPFEPSADRTCAEVTLTSWPGGSERLVATAGYHGAGVRYRLSAPRGTRAD